MPETLASWLDLTVPNAVRAKEFYCAVLGTTTSAIAMKDHKGEYEDFCLYPCAKSGADADAGPGAGVCHARGANADVPAVWIPYFTIPNLNHAMDAATQRGGKVIYGPKTCGGSMQIVLIRDPDGATFGLACGEM